MTRTQLVLAGLLNIAGYAPQPVTFVVAPEPAAPPNRSREEERRRRQMEKARQRRTAGEAVSKEGRDAGDIGVG
jgi:hypothetical protein